MAKQGLRWIPAFIWAGIICFLSFSALTSIPIPSFISADKIAHIGMYFILECLLVIPLTWNTKSFWISTAFVVLFSLLTELIQHHFVVNRFGEVGDFLANMVGITFALFIIKKKNKP